MTNSYVIPISVKGIIFEDNCVWLRKNERDEWELPGGKLDKGEQPEQAVLRELREELGFETDVTQLIQAYIFTIQGSLDESTGVLVLSYLCKLVRKTGTFEVKGEAGAATFQKFPVKEILTLPMPDFYKEAIQIAWRHL